MVLRWHWGVWSNMGNTVETKPKNKGGRPKTVIDYERVLELASIFCTQAEIATLIKVPLSTCTHDEEFLRIYREGIEQAKTSIRRMQYETAKRGSTDMQKWIGKQYIGQSDKVENKNDDRVTIVIAGDDANV